MGGRKIVLGANYWIFAVNVRHPRRQIREEALYCALPSVDKRVVFAQLNFKEHLSKKNL